MAVSSPTPPVLDKALRAGRKVYGIPLSALDDLGAQLSFYVQNPSRTDPS